MAPAPSRRRPESTPRPPTLRVEALDRTRVAQV